MPKTANKISLLIEDQLPAFISDEYELFVVRTEVLSVLNYKGNH